MEFSTKIKQNYTKLSWFQNSWIGIVERQFKILILLANKISIIPDSPKRYMYDFSEIKEINTL